MAIVIRYNLINAKLCGPVLANFFAVVVPFLFSIPFYTGDGLQSVIAWTGLFVNGLVNFVVPIVLYIIALRNHKRGRVISIEEDGASIFDLGRMSWNGRDATFAGMDDTGSRVCMVRVRCGPEEVGRGVISP